MDFSQGMVCTGTATITANFESLKTAWHCEKLNLQVSGIVHYKNHHHHYQTWAGMLCFPCLAIRAGCLLCLCLLTFSDKCQCSFAFFCNQFLLQTCIDKLACISSAPVYFLPLLLSCSTTRPWSNNIYILTKGSCFLLSVIYNYDRMDENGSAVRSPDTEW